MAKKLSKKEIGKSITNEFIGFMNSKGFTDEDFNPKKLISKSGRSFRKPLG